MAALEFNLEGLTEEQLRAARQFQQRLGGARAARVAGPTPAAAPTPQIVNTTAQSAARATAGPAQGTVGVNPAPGVTATAAAEPSLGTRILRGARRLGGGLVRGIGGLQAGLGVSDVARGSYGSGIENIALGTATAVNPVVGTVGNLLAGGRDFVMRNVIDYLYGQNQTFLPQPKTEQKTTGVGAARAPRTPVNAEALISGTAVPEVGTGAFKRQGGRAVAIDARDALAAAPTAGAAPAAAPAPAVITTPRLSTEGNIFEAAANLGGDILATAAQVGAARRGAKAARAETELGLKRGELAVKGEEAVSSRIKALADVEKAGTAGLKVVTDLTGNPIVVDTRASTATKPAVQQEPTASDIRTTAAKNNMTEAQVVARLVQEGRISANSALARRYTTQ